MPSPSVSFTGLDRIQALLRELQGELARLERPDMLSVVATDASCVADTLALAKLFLSPATGTSELALLKEALALVARLAGSRAAVLKLHDAHHGHHEAFYDPIDPTRAFERPARAIAEQVVEKGTALAIPELAGDPRFAEEAAEGELGAVLALPLVGELNDANVVGALVLARNTDQPPYDEAAIAHSTRLAAFLSDALAATRRLRDWQDHQLRFSLLNRLYESLARSLNLEEVLDQVATIALELSGAERTFVLLRAHDQLFFGAGRDANGPLNQQATRKMSRSACRRVIETGEGLHIYDMAEDDKFAKRPSVVNLHICSVAAVPLIGPDGVSGVLYADARDKVLPELARTREALEAVARVASLAVESARLYHQATVDGLTGLYVRSFFMLRLDEEVRRARRYDRPFALLVMDIDHFKRINDTYGHQAGDEVIKLVAVAIRDAVRAGVDLPGRYGGDEMTVLLPETSAEGAAIVAERIRKVVSELSIALPGIEPIKITLSIGMAVYPGGGDNGSQLFANADMALYKAKQAGRNCVKRYGE